MSIQYRAESIERGWVDAEEEEETGMNMGIEGTWRHSCTPNSPTKAFNVRWRGFEWY